MNYAQRNRKVALARWKKKHDFETSLIPCGKNADVMRAALLGFIAGDGSIVKRPKVSHFEIKCYPDDEIMLEAYCCAFRYLYSKEPEITFRDGVFHAKKTSKIAALDLNHCKLSTYDWEIPLFETFDEKIAWLKAFFSAEAYVGKDHIKIQTVNEIGMVQLKHLLEEVGINSKLYYYNSKKLNEKTVHIVNIRGKENMLKYAQTVGFWHSRKAQKLAESLDL